MLTSQREDGSRLIRRVLHIVLSQEGYFPGIGEELTTASFINFWEVIKGLSLGYCSSNLIEFMPGSLGAMVHNR